MINEANLRKYCCEDISLIENYNEAVNDTTQMWQCHHKLEIKLHKTSQELIEMGLYYNRPASELIILTEKNHKSLHYKSGISNFCTKYGKDHPMYGKPHSEDTKQKMKKPKSEEHKQKLRKPKSEEHKQKLSKIHKDNPKQKYKWLTPTGEIRIMSIPNANCWHPDWIKIGEA